MSVKLPYREIKAQKLTFEILERRGIFDGVDVDDWKVVRRRLQSIEKLNISDLDITDLSIIGKMINLKKLNINRTQVADISWARSLRHLKIIRFSSTPVSGLDLWLN